MRRGAFLAVASCAIAAAPFLPKLPLLDRGHADLGLLEPVAAALPEYELIPAEAYWVTYTLKFSVTGPDGGEYHRVPSTVEFLSADR